MGKRILTTIALLPLLLNVSQATQRWTVLSSQPFGFPSEDSGTSSYLGVDIADITSDRLGALKLKEEKGVEVTMVDQDAPSGKAGMKEHDVILTMNGTAIESKTQLQRMIHETPPGRVVTLGLSRDGQAMIIKVQLADRRSEFVYRGSKEKDKDWDKNFHVEIAPIPNIPPIPNMPDFEVPNISVVVVQSSARSGLMVENMTPQLGEFFGAKNGNGVLVRAVEKGSRADKAGLRAGDVITRVGEQSVHDTSDFTHALHSHSGGSVSVAVIRDKKEQTLTIALPERRDSGEMIEEESLEAPEADAETQIDSSEVQNEIAKLQPQMELAREEIRKASTEACLSLSSHQREMRDQARKQRHELESQQKQIRQMTLQAEKLSRELQPKIQEELQKSREKLQQEMDQFRRKVAASLDI